MGRVLPRRVTSVSSLPKCDQGFKHDQGFKQGVRWQVGKYSPLCVCKNVLTSCYMQHIP